MEDFFPKDFLLVPFSSRDSRLADQTGHAIEMAVACEQLCDVPAAPEMSFELFGEAAAELALLTLVAGLATGPTSPLLQVPLVLRSHQMLQVIEVSATDFGPADLATLEAVAIGIGSRQELAHVVQASEVLFHLVRQVVGDPAEAAVISGLEILLLPSLPGRLFLFFLVVLVFVASILWTPRGSLSFSSIHGHPVFVAPQVLVEPLWKLILPLRTDQQLCLVVTSVDDVIDENTENSQRWST